MVPSTTSTALVCIVKIFIFLHHVKFNLLATKGVFSHITMIFFCVLLNMYRTFLLNEYF